MGQDEANNYVLRGGAEGAERLRLLARAVWPTTRSFLRRLGLRQGMHCLDAGCGIGAVSLKLSGRVGVSGKVVGIDLDERPVWGWHARREPGETFSPSSGRRA